jgi:hypothetical protein
VAAGAVLLAAGTANADVAGQLQAGVGTDSTASDGFATGRGELSVDLTTSEVPIAERGLGDAQCTPDTLCPGGRPLYLWVLTGVDPEERAGFGAHGTGELHVAGDRVIGVATGRASVHGYGWGLEAGVAVQPVGELRDRFWRPGRDIVQDDAVLTIPAMFTIGTVRSQVLLLPWQIELGHRTEVGGGGWRSAGWDRAVSTVVARVQRPTVEVDAISFQYAELGVASVETATTSYGTSATMIDLDAASVKLHLSDSLDASGYFGIAMRMPIAAYMIVDGAETATGPIANVPHYWAELRHHDETWTTSLGLGSWERIDPTGHAADAGQMFSLQAGRTTRRFQLAGRIEGGQLRRVVVGAFAPPELAPAGTRFRMGRAELAATMRLARDVDLTGTTWLEHSDRDDPRWTVPADGAVTTHAGGDVTARWRFR